MWWSQLNVKPYIGYLADQHSIRTLAGMFPDLDKDIIDDVVRVKQGR